MEFVVNIQQFGCRKRFSSSDAILNSLNSLYDSKHFPGLSKAFDLLDHKTLFEKFERYGTGDVAPHIVQINSEKLSTVLFSKGVPQGSFQCKKFGYFPKIP